MQPTIQAHVRGFGETGCSQNWILSSLMFDPEYNILSWTEEFSINIQERDLPSDEDAGDLLLCFG